MNLNYQFVFLRQAECHIIQSGLSIIQIVIVGQWVN